MIDPITLLTVGPTALRAVGALFGNDSKAAEVANKVADVAEAVRGQPRMKQEQAIEQAQAAMTSQERQILGEIHVRLEQIAAEREARQYQHAETLYESTQQTFRATERYGTDYAKNTRPLLARLSGYAGLLLAVIWVMAYLLGRTSHAPDAVVIGAVMSMAYAYMGMRTVDGFGQSGKS